MEKVDTKNSIPEMDILTAKRERQKLSKHIAHLRSKDTIKLETYVSAEKKNALMITINWLYSHEFIKKKTRYSFLKFSVEEMIKNVLAQQEKEQEQIKQQSMINNQIQPSTVNDRTTSRQP